jgi:hypothetical protein
MDLLNNMSLVLRGDLNEVNLQKMNFFSFPDTTTLISADIVARTNGFDLDSLRGFIDFRNAMITTQTKNYDIDYLNIRTRNDSTANILTLNSNIFSLVAEGQYSIDGLTESVTSFINNYIPDFSLLTKNQRKNEKNQRKTEKNQRKNKINLRLEVKDFATLSELLALNMHIAPQSILTANISPEQDLNLELKSDYFIYDTYAFKDISLLSKTHNGNFYNKISINDIKLTDSLNISENSLQLKFNRNDIELGLKAGMGDKNQLSTQLNFKGFLSENGLLGSFSNSPNDSLVTLSFSFEPVYSVSIFEVNPLKVNVVPSFTFSINSGLLSNEFPSLSTGINRIWLQTEPGTITPDFSIKLRT